MMLNDETVFIVFTWQALVGSNTLQITHKLKAVFLRKQYFHCKWQNLAAAWDQKKHQVSFDNDAAM